MGLRQRSHAKRSVEPIDELRASHPGIVIADAATAQHVSPEFLSVANDLLIDVSDLAPDVPDTTVAEVVTG